jgi:hypothetical protein
MCRQVELSDEEIKKIIAILKFSKDACPIESLPEVERLVSKFEKTLAYIVVPLPTPVTI